MVFEKQGGEWVSPQSTPSTTFTAKQGAINQLTESTSKIGTRRDRNTPKKRSDECCYQTCSTTPVLSANASTSTPRRRSIVK